MPMSGITEEVFKFAEWNWADPFLNIKQCWLLLRGRPELKGIGERSFYLQSEKDLLCVSAAL